MEHKPITKISGDRRQYRNPLDSIDVVELYVASCIVLIVVFFTIAVVKVLI